MRIYPNPATDLVNISGIVQAYSVHLLNFSGRTIYSGTNEHSINLSGLSEGIYFLKITIGNGDEQVWKLIKN